MDTDSKLATLSSRLGIAAVVLLVLGPMLCQLGVAPMRGFGVFAIGLIFGLAALVLGTVGLWLTRASAGRAGRGRALTGSGLGILVFAIVATAASPGRDVPPINDITTDTADPPEFIAAAEIPANRERDLAYPGPEFAEQQRAGYPDLVSQRLERPPVQALADVRAAAERLGWVVAAEDPTTGHLEATDTTRFFRFVDDVVVRVRPDGSGSIVDIRSKSRDGRGDLGANAARIRALQGSL
ncbi:MAG: DUF1499 domain-containing protein [Myxococcota bacterium]|nr:DUF1499 domain-containing protein [bacterium]MDP6073447.1 DUF1499 domain-containing protein [Myxococcota bacterium]MDP6244118.1 DUF1499 domain-containing protein [Myxococcota bacterium]MDP7074486.1 DUF1499 domain-containing protein [Myxococcota bacterium]MDP7301364.1 DUF1499 domain-containing protein [Myxococcota bacterium]